MYSEDVILKKKRKATKKEKVEKQKLEEKRLTVPKLSLKLPSSINKLALRLGILLFIFFVLIFFTTKIGLKSETKNLDENLNQIKTASYQYYKENNRPSNPNEEYAITLQDLVDEEYLKPIKDKKGNLCNGDSEIVLKKNTDTKYDLSILLLCNNQEHEKNYTLTYKKDSNTDSQLVYYKLEKEIVSNNYDYSCPEGYTLNDRYCYPTSTTLTETPIAKYKNISKRVTKASYKKGEDNYEYVDPVRTSTLNNYTCSNKKATLIGNECVTEVDYKNEYICSAFYPKKSGNRCYYVDNATEVWSNWTLLAEQTFTTKKEDTNTKYYELVRTYQENNRTKYVYRYYTRVKTYQCPTSIHEDIELKGKKCYHYEAAISTKTCPSGYSLNFEQTKCIKKEQAKKLSDTTDYICPTGYTQEGKGDNMKCYRKTSNDGYYYCKNTDYRLEGDQCIRDASSELIGYKCPSGYKLNGNVCTKSLSDKKKNATKTKNSVKEKTYKWSEQINEKGWIWTGETKEL